MQYRLYFNGCLYDKTVYKSKEEAKAEADKCNADKDLVRRFGAVYVADKYGQYVC